MQEEGLLLPAPLLAPAAAPAPQAAATLVPAPAPEPTINGGASLLGMPSAITEVTCRALWQTACPLKCKHTIPKTMWPQSEIGSWKLLDDCYARCERGAWAHAGGPCTQHARV